MKFYFHKTKGQFIEYNIRLIEHVMGSYMTDALDDADIVMVSLCDVTEVDEVLKAKRLGKPVIVGGMISEYPIVNELSDYVWHGEIYKLRELLDQGMKLVEMPYITTKDNRKLVINQEIKWQDNPIIKVGNRAMYYYLAKGCPIKCKYCYIGNVRDYQVAPKNLYDKAISIAQARLMPIAAYNPYGMTYKTNIGETLLKKYIAGQMDKGANVLRSGVEFVTPSLSKNIAKGVTIDDVNEAICRSRTEKTQLILYYIAGLETQEQLESYWDNVVNDYAIRYPVTIVYTYIDPQPFTPMYDYDVRGKITNIDCKRLYWIANQRNKRIRFIPLARPEKSLTRTFLARAVSMDDYRHIKNISKMKHADMINSSINRPHLIGSETLDAILTRRREPTMPEYWRVATMRP